MYLECAFENMFYRKYLKTHFDYTKGSLYEANYF